MCRREFLIKEEQLVHTAPKNVPTWKHEFADLRAMHHYAQVACMLYSGVQQGNANFSLDGNVIISSLDSALRQRMLVDYLEVFLS